MTVRVLTEVQTISRHQSHLSLLDWVMSFRLLSPLFHMLQFSQRLVVSSSGIMGLSWVGSVPDIARDSLEILEDQNNLRLLTQAIRNSTPLASI